MDENLLSKLEAAGLTLSEYDEFTDELITDDEIDLMQLHEIKRPPNVTVARWEQPRVLTHRHKKIIHLAALGKTQPQIAAEVGMHIATVHKLIRAPKFQKAISKKQDNLFENDAKQYMKTLMNKSYATIEGILEDPEEKSSVKLEAAKYVIDHVIGKATQVVAHTDGSLLNQFLSRLDNQREVIAIQSTPAEPEYVATEVNSQVADEKAATALKILEKEHDAMDTLVDSIIQGDFVVGRRDKNGTGT